MVTWTEMRGGKSSSGLSPVAGFGISSAEHLVYNTIHCEVCLATGPAPVIKRTGFSVSSFKFHYPLFYSRTSSGCLVFFLIFSSLYLFTLTGILNFYADSLMQRYFSVHKYLLQCQSFFAKMLVLPTQRHIWEQNTDQKGRGKEFWAQLITLTFPLNRFKSCTPINTVIPIYFSLFKNLLRKYRVYSH